MPNSRMKPVHRHKKSAVGTRRLKRNLKNRTAFQDRMHEASEKAAAKPASERKGRSRWKHTTGGAKRTLRRVLHVLRLKRAEEGIILRLKREQEASASE